MGEGELYPVAEGGRRPRVGLGGGVGAVSRLPADHRLLLHLGRNREEDLHQPANLMDRVEKADCRLRKTLPNA
jgi:hypothetical protein